MDDSGSQEKTGFLAALQRVPGWVVPVLLVGVPGLVYILGRLSPWFYDHIVWKYYWGPIVTDGSERHVLCTVGDPIELSRGKLLFWSYERFGCTDPAGVASIAGYNPVNTITWAVLMFVCIFGIAQLLTRYKVPMDPQMILAATSWVTVGSVWHVIQDSQVFAQPLEFLMITPPIWLLFGAFGVGSMVIAVYLDHIHRQTGSLELALQKAWMMFGIITLIYFMLWMTDWNQIRVYMNPLVAAFGALLAWIVFRAITLRKGRIVHSVAVATFSIGWWVVGLNQYLAFYRDPWGPEVPTYELNFAIYTVPLLALGVVAIVYAVAKFLAGKGKEGALAFLKPINLFIVFSQMVDAFSTAVGIDISNYSEKHVLSEAVRHWSSELYRNLGWQFGAEHPTFLGFAPVKLIVSLLVVYAIDVQGKDDMKKYPTMMNLIKFAVIMVGIGPGVRNTLRMTLGI